MATTTTLPTKLPLALLAALALTTQPAAAADFALTAGRTTLTMPDGAQIAVWGFGLGDGPITVPGPVLTVPPGDGTLRITLRNTLLVPISIVIPGQPATMTPVFSGGRVRSFTKETPPGGTEVYEWSGLAPGTYLYQSGTHPQVQVQMGLYGAVRKDAAVGLAYDGVPYAVDVPLVLSELDPDLHLAVDTGTYGTADYPSTMCGRVAGSTCGVGRNEPCCTGYQPRYFLVNGAPHTAGRACVPGGDVGDRVLLRMLNAGLRELAPTLVQGHWSVVAEGGRPYRIADRGSSTPRAKEQYSMLLPPGGTGDAVLAPEVAGSYVLLDRRLNLTNGAATGGGFQACVAVGARTGQPVADAGGPYSGTAGTAVQFSSAASNPNGGTIATYSWDFGDGATSTSAAPSHAYAAAGTYAVRLTITDSDGLTSAPDWATASIAPANVPPVANAGGPYAGRAGFPIAFSGAGSSDADGDLLTYAWDFGDGGAGTGVAPSHTYAAAGTYPVKLTVNDGRGGSAQATATATVTVNRPPIANAGGPYAPSGLVVTFSGAGSTDADGDPLTYAWNFGDGTTGSGVGPVHAYAVPGTYTVTLRVNDGYVGSAPATTTATISALPPSSKHVGDLDWTAANLAGSRWRATVTVTVHDQNHAPLANVTVNGAWSAGDTSGRTTSCTTAANGRCSVQSGRLSRTANPTVAFTVNSLGGAGGAYVQGANHDPDAAPQASNGTSVTAPRP